MFDCSNRITDDTAGKITRIANCALFPLSVAAFAHFDVEIFSNASTAALGLAIKQESGLEKKSNSARRASLGSCNQRSSCSTFSR